MLLPLSLFSLIFLGGGCLNFAAETAIEQQIKSDTGESADVDIENDNITYTDEETKGKVSVGTDISLPSDFPSDFPVYDGDLTIISAANVPQEGVTLSFTSQDSLQEIITWYEQKLTSAGWVRDQEFDLQGRQMRSYTKEDLRMVISIDEDAGVTTAVVVRSEK